MKEKILFIIPYLVGGGALKTVANLSSEMQKKYDVTIIGVYKSEKKFDFKGNLIELNLEYSKNPIKKLYDFFKIRKLVKKIKTDNKFKYSLSFLVIADILNVFSKSKNKEKTIISIRNNESVEYKKKFFRRTQVKIATKLCDYIVAISKEVEEDLIKNFNVDSQKIRTIYNPCVINIKNESINNNLFVKDKTIITLGGLKYQKGQWHLIRSMSKVVKEIPDAKLLIFGRGNEEKYLKDLVNNLNLENNVYFGGYVLNPHDYVVKSNLFVFSSLFEGLGNALMEMLSCGIPVISTDYSCGAREILAPNTDFKIKTKNKICYEEYGVLIPVCDGKKYTTEELTIEENIMSDAIIEMLKNKKLRETYKLKSYERAEDFKLCNIVNEWYDLFDFLNEEETYEKI